MTSATQDDARTRGRPGDDFEVVRAGVLAGPNRWRREPVVTADVEPASLLGDPRAYARVLARVHHHVASLERTEEGGRAWAALVAAVALALQHDAGSDAGSDASWCRTGDGEEPGAWSVALGYEEPEVGLAALRAAARVIRAAAADEPLDWEDETRWLGRLLARERLPAALARLVGEARQRGIPVRRVPDEAAVVLGHGVHARRIDAADADEGTLDARFPGAATGRIPLVAVTGTNGKTTTTRLVAHLLRASGLHTGLTTTDGVYVDGALVFEGDMTGPMAAEMVLGDPRVEAAALETARGGILRAGLGFDRCDVGVVLNVSPDHLGLRGIHTVEQLAEVKAVIVDAVRDDGHAVLNADDPLVWAMRARTTATIVAFSMAAGATVAAHLAAGGMAVTLEPSTADGHETITLRRGDEATPLIAAADVPLTDGGAARFQVANALAATAAAWAAGIAPAALRAGLASFAASRETTPGRMNVVQVHGATVIVDYAHNPAAIRALLDYGHHRAATRRIGVLHTPGDRRDDDIRTVGSLAAGLDHVVFMENPHYMRGRAAGGSHALLLEGFTGAGGDRDAVTLVEGQPAAVEAVLRQLVPGALVLFVADDAGEVIGLLEASEASYARRARDATPA